MAQIIQVDTSQKDALKEVRTGISRLAVLDRYLKTGSVSGNCTFTYDGEGKKRHMVFPCKSDVFETVLMNEAGSISARVTELSKRYQIGLEEHESDLTNQYLHSKKRAAK